MVIFFNLREKEEPRKGGHSFQSLYYDEGASTGWCSFCKANGGMVPLPGVVLRAPLGTHCSFLGFRPLIVTQPCLVKRSHVSLFFLLAIISTSVSLMCVNCFLYNSGFNMTNL